MANLYVVTLKADGEGMFADSASWQTRTFIEDYFGHALQQLNLQYGLGSYTILNVYSEPMPPDDKCDFRKKPKST